MARKSFLGYILAFILAVLTMAGIVYAQTPTPETKGEVTPTPTPRAPATGLGGSR